VEGIHVTSTSLLVTPVAVTPVGTVGACVSELPDPIGEFMSAWICACVRAVL
jgi:hypothetical protein